MTPKRIFITYGTKNFDLQKKHIINLAKSSNFFDECISYGPNDLQKSFVQEHENILRLEKGAGFWIWKYQIIKQTIDQLKENDIVIYSDSGSSLNPKGSARYSQYIDMLIDSKYSMLRFKLDYLEKFWTIKEIFDYFNVKLDSNIANSNQLLAGHIILKKTESLNEQLNMFRNLINFDNSLITDKYDNNQIEGFKSNRHDQSIFSLISKLSGYIEIENEVWFQNNREEQYDYPFLAVQQRSYSFWQKLKFYLFYKKHINNTVFFGEKRYIYQKPSILKRIIYKFK